MDRTGTDLRQPREPIIAVLDYLGEREMMEVQAAGVRHRFLTLKRPDDLDAPAKKLHDRALRRETNEMERLNQVVGRIEHDGCQVTALSAHFGEPRDPCGHCSWCLNGKRPARMPDRSRTTIDQDVWSNVEALRRAQPDVLGDARLLARLLCGVSSPSPVKAKLTTHELFGALDRVPFRKVLERANGALR